MVLTVTTVL